MTPTVSAAMARAVAPGHGESDQGRAELRGALEAVDRAIEQAGRLRVRHTRGCPTTPDPHLATVTGDELAALIGPQAARYAVIRQARNPAAPIEIGRWVRQNDDNPIFAVQFAHARLSAVARYAAALARLSAGTDGCPGTGERLPTQREASPAVGPDLQTGATGATIALRQTVDEYQRVLVNVTERRQPHRLTRYLERLATAVRDYLCVVRVLPTRALPPDSESAAEARLQLAADARRILADGLGVLGVTAPERM